MQWHAATHSITAVNSDAVKVTLTNNNKTAIAEGNKIQLRKPPIIRKSHALIPLRFFSEQFGAWVSWQQETHTVIIHSPREDLHTLAFYAIRSFQERDWIAAFDTTAFGWGRLNDEGKLSLKGKDYYWPESAGDVTPDSLVQKASNGYFMVYASDINGELSKLIENKDLQQQFISRLLEIVKDHHFKGALLDFEGLGLSGDIPKVQKQFNTFVQRTATQLHQAGKKLTLSLHPLNSSYHGYDYATLGTEADEIIVMAYNYNKSSSTGQEPLQKVDEAIRLTLKKVPAGKVLLGISMGSEQAETLRGKIGLAKRYGLKGIAVWWLGLIGKTAYSELARNVVLKS